MLSPKKWDPFSTLFWQRHVCRSPLSFDLHVRRHSLQAFPVRTRVVQSATASCPSRAHMAARNLKQSLSLSPLTRSRNSLAVLWQTTSLGRSLLRSSGRGPGTLSWSVIRNATTRVALRRLLRLVLRRHQAPMTSVLRCPEDLGKEGVLDSNCRPITPSDWHSHHQEWALTVLTLPKLEDQKWSYGRLVRVAWVMPRSCRKWIKSSYADTPPKVTIP